MEYSSIENKMLQSFEYETTVNNDGNILGICELGKAKIQLINENNSYSTYKGSWISTPHGSFYVYDVKPVQENVTIELSCYDIKYKLDTPYDSAKHTFPCTLKEWRNSIFNDCGVTYDNIDFPNSDLTLSEEPYLDDGITNRNVVALIAQAGASIVITDNQDKFYFSWFNDTIHNVIDWLELTTEKNPTKSVNFLVLSRGDAGDDYYYPLTIPENKVEFKIDSNYILDPQDTTSETDLRATTIIPLYNRINGFSYIIYSMRTQFIENKLTLKLGDKIKYKDVYGNELTSYVMSKKITWLGGDLTDSDNYELTISAREINETSTEVSYKKKDVNKSVIELSRKTDKAMGMIKDAVKKVDDLTDYIKTKQETSSIELLKTPDSTGAINKLSIKNFNLQTLYPDMAYPSDYTYPGVLNFYTLIISNEKVIYSPSLPTANNQTELYNVGGISGKFYRCVDNVWTEETKLDNIKFIYINSPFPLQTLTTTMGDHVYDELIFEDNQVSIIQRLDYDEENNLEVLEKPVTYNLGEMLVPTFETNTYITMKYWTNLNYECTYIEKNEFTSSFTTKNETNAIISITDEINLKVENKCGKDDVVNQLNISKDLIEIKGNRFVLDADNVKIDKFGNIILSNGAKVLGEYGLLSSIIVESNIMSRSFIGGNMILPMGYSQYEETSSGSITTIKDSLQLQFTIPKGFKIMSAFILLEHMPTKYKDGTTLKYTGTSKNLKLYRATNYSAGTFVMDITRYVTNNSEINYSEVPNAFGVSGFSGSSSGYTSKQSINIKDFITTSDTEDSFNMFKIETSNSLVTSLAAMYQNTGACKATLMIMGYSSFE
jgi:hypothetical protein